MEALWDEEDLYERQNRIIEIWANARSLYLAGEADGSRLPETKKEAEGGPNFQKNKDFNRDLAQARRAWLTAVMSPVHFAAELGMGELFPDVPEDKLEAGAAKGQRAAAEDMARAHEEMQDRIRASLARRRQQRMVSESVEPATEADVKREIDRNR
jgi:hypothetical protein